MAAYSEVLYELRFGLDVVHKGRGGNIPKFYGSASMRAISKVK